MEPQDHAAMRAGADGDSPDIGALYLRHRDAMYGMARSLLRGDEHRAEDVVQAVMVSLLAHMPSGVRNWEAFLVHAVKMKVYDLWKSAAQTHEMLTFDDVRPLESERLGADDLDVDPAVLVEEEYDRAATASRVRIALAELERREPEAAYAYRQVKEVGRTSQDVAEELALSSARVRQRVMKARTELIEILGMTGGGQ